MGVAAGSGDWREGVNKARSLLNYSNFALSQKRFAVAYKGSQNKTA